MHGSVVSLVNFFHVYSDVLIFVAIHYLLSSYSDTSIFWSSCEIYFALLLILFDDEIIKVRRTRIQGKNGPPKKKASVRDVEMLSGVKEFFLQQYKLTGGDPKGDVFLNSSRKPFYSHDIIAVQFKKLLEEGDKRYLYQLRHSFATMMITRGEDILWVSRMLGHKSSDITLKTYARAYELSKDKSKRQKRAEFLEKGHSLGTVNNIDYLKAPKIGENR